ncbi:MAG: pyridoxal phosphate-dependent aminotransferase family protein, partial [Pseudomonadota bacterium]
RAVEKFGVGMGGPPLLNGTHVLHRQLEEQLAEIKRAEDSLLFSSGFQANVGWCTALLRSRDVVLYDELSHASLFDGIRLTKTTEKIKAYRFRHNDIEDLERLLKSFGDPEGGIVYVVTEGVFSMEGDLGALDKIAQLKSRYKFVFVVDDAHGTGVLGPQGQGTSEHFGVSGSVDLHLGTFSKSFGVTGGFIAGSKSLVNFLRFFSRTYLFSAHLPQTLVASVLAGLETLKTKPEVLYSLNKNRELMSQGLRSLGLPYASPSAIFPIPVPETVDIRALAKRIEEKGIFTNTIEYPAVPISSQRIRASVMASHEEGHIDTFMSVLESVKREFRF